MSLSVYQQCFKEVKGLYQDLGISPRERIKLKIEVEKADAFAQEFE